MLISHFHARTWNGSRADTGPAQWPREAAGTAQAAQVPFCWFLVGAGCFAFVPAARLIIHLPSPELASAHPSYLRFNFPSLERSSLPFPGRCPAHPSSAFFVVVVVVVFCFLGPHLRHMGISRLGDEFELQLLAYTTATAMQDPSRVCDLTTPRGNARSLTH